ncbi:unnamed protein product [Miscanthus lutarioriparius]|uniref:Uncharacterized protein n=1 Tax=Miscanthus lutarioriparius TaxID=422564 RepID=A0A811S748_9POAL|nr:unnamed protein product [Miscanthus lutarioriparius]
MQRIHRLSLLAPSVISSLLRCISPPPLLYACSILLPSTPPHLLQLPPPVPPPRPGHHQFAVNNLAARGSSAHLHHVRRRVEAAMPVIGGLHFAASARRVVPPTFSASRLRRLRWGLLGSCAVVLPRQRQGWGIGGGGSAARVLPVDKFTLVAVVAYSRWGRQRDEEKICFRWLPSSSNQNFQDANYVGLTLRILVCFVWPAAPCRIPQICEVW